MRHTTSLFALAVIATLAACDEPGTNCTLEAVTSVSVNVKDVDGAAIDDAEVVYTVDDGDEEDCDNLGEGRYACGAEVAGDFVVTAIKAGYADAERGVTVEDGECHVAGETVELILVETGPTLP